MKFESFSETQLRALSWWSDFSPYRHCDAIICDGAVRSGKTLCMGISYVCWAMRRFDAMRFAVCGRSVASVRRNIIEPLLPVLADIGFEVRELVSKNYMDVSYMGRTNRLYYFGGSDESSASRIQGMTLAGILMDEAALMPRSFVEQACARCSVEGSKMWFNCNPDSPQHWFYREWILKAEARNCLYLHFSLEDNPSLSPGIIARYKGMYTGDFYRRFILGEWVLPQGRIYDFFDESMQTDPPEGCTDYAVSCDYGTANPSSFGFWGRKDGIWYRLREFYYDSRKEGKQKTDAEYVTELKGLCGGIVPSRVIVDPSAASFISALQREGISAVKADNDVLRGIRLTADALKSGKIKICRGCDDLLREISEYRWDESKEREAPYKFGDHAMDDMRYFVTAMLNDCEPVGAVWVDRRN